jgi:uncharacterized protein (DUF302 family)
MTSESACGIVTQKSAHSVSETVKRLEEALLARKIKLFAVIDHSGEAEQVGLRMANTKLLLFGAPQAGTPIMLSAPSSALVIGGSKRSQKRRLKAEPVSPVGMEALAGTR